MVILVDKISDLAFKALYRRDIHCHCCDESFKTPEQWEQKLEDTGGLTIEAVGLRGDSIIDAEAMAILSRFGATLIVRFGSGVNNINVEAATHYGIAVENVAGQNANGVVELVFLHLLTLERNLPEINRLVFQGQKPGKESLHGREIFGKTLGVIGTGWIGSLVIKKALAWGLEILAFDPDPDKRVEGAHYVEPEQLFGNADYITVHVPLKEDTVNLIGAEQIKKMRRQPIIINCARSGIVNLEAVAAGLENGSLSGYGSDVDEQDHPVFKLPRTFFTPHIGAKTDESEERCAVAGAGQIINWLKFGGIENSLNLPDNSPRPMKQDRIVIINKDQVGSLREITDYFTSRGLNINLLENAGHKQSGLAITLIELDGPFEDSLIGDLSRLESVVRIFGLRREGEKIRH